MENVINLFIVVPCYAGQLYAECVQSLLNLSTQLARENLLHQVRFQSGSNIATSRNELAAEFLQTDGTHLLFCDADSEFPSEAVAEMLRADKDIISLCFAGKSLDWDRACEAAQLGVSAPELSAAAVPVIEGDVIAAIMSPPFQVPFVGFGLCLIKRQVFELLKSVCDTYTRYKTNDKGWAFFGPIIDPATNYLLSEDYSFCLRANKVGIRPYFLSTHRTVHHGTHGYVFDPATLIDIDRRAKRRGCPDAPRG
jgi:hypothetical protein